jgi:hypothetical protein
LQSYAAKNYEKIKASHVFCANLCAARHASSSRLSSRNSPVIADRHHRLGQYRATLRTSGRKPRK